jgi:two-component system OmpR family sensor kinase
MKRIEIASKTLSRLYEDLTYLKLNHNYHREVISLNFSELIYERIEFFRTLIESKSLILHFHIKENIIIKIDKNDAIRLIDNLLSNAIKYNQKEGLLSITLEAKELSVEDSGVGIKKRDIHLIQNRFKRSNQSEGGFGIGLDIVNQVVQRYHFTFNITSTFQQGTKVTITW